MITVRYAVESFSQIFMDLGIVKDHLVWGDNYNGSNILSGRTPSLPMMKSSFESGEMV